jgi:hypothetical protein
MSDENKSLIEWLREDISTMRSAFENMGKEFVELSGRIKNLNEKCEYRGKNCPAILAMTSNTSKNKGIVWWLMKLGPIILAAALGLLGLGAYFGSGQSIEKLESQMATMQKAMKLVQPGE